MSSIEYIGFDHSPDGAAARRCQAAMVNPPARPEWKSGTQGSTIVGEKDRVIIEQLMVRRSLVDDFQLRKPKNELFSV